MNKMKIKLIFQNASGYKVYSNVQNAYTKGELYCIELVIGGERIVHKYPLSSIFRIEEEYNYPKI